MRTHSISQPKNKGAAFLYFVVFLATFCIVAFLIWATKQYTQPASITANRAAERADNLKSVREAVGPILSEYGWQDKEKGFVRVPIERAMELTVKEWSNPSEGRAKMIERMKEATFVPPPPPEAPSAFE